MVTLQFEVIDCHIHPPVDAASDLSWYDPVPSREAFVAELLDWRDIPGGAGSSHRGRRDHVVRSLWRP